MTQQRQTNNNIGNNEVYIKTKGKFNKLIVNERQDYYINRTKIKKYGQV